MYNFCVIMIVIVILLSISDLLPIEVYLRLVEKGEVLDLVVADFSAKVIDKNIADEIKKIIIDDLTFSRYFNIYVDTEPYTAKKEQVEAWRKNKIEVAICGMIIKQAEKIAMIGEVIDIESNEKILTKRIIKDKKDIRTIAHEFSDEFVYRFTGNKGIATSKIVFSNDSTGAREIYIVDYDGYNLERLTYDNSKNLFPVISDKREEVVYTSYKHGRPELYCLNLKTRKNNLISKRKGLNVAWDITKEDEILSTLTFAGDPELAIISKSGEVKKRLTFNPGIDTVGSFSPTARQLVFTSDRIGFPQIYIMDAEGTNIRRIETDYHSSDPCWSPLGDKIAFSMEDETGYQNIYIYDILSDKKYRLTVNSGDNESPSFSPDGRFIAFTSTRNKKNEIFIISLDGAMEVRLNIPGNSYTPYWQ